MGLTLVQPVRSLEANLGVKRCRKLKEECSTIELPGVRLGRVTALTELFWSSETLSTREDSEVLRAVPDATAVLYSPHGEQMLQRLVKQSGGNKR